MENGIQLTFDFVPMIISPEQTVGASAHPVRTSQSQVTEKDLAETEVPSFVKYLEFSGRSKKPIDPSGLSTKMLRECLVAIEGGTLPQLSLKWSNWGMISNGSCSTQKISEYRKTESECMLLDILEEEVESKYFLSKEQTEKIVFAK